MLVLRCFGGCWGESVALEVRYTKTRSGERKPKVTRPDDSKDYTYSIGVGVSVGGANKGGLDAALKRYVGARPMNLIQLSIEEVRELYHRFDFRHYDAFTYSSNSLWNTIKKI
jgi:hypothetical protein